MNVPHASHMGGFWEHQIRSVQNVRTALLSCHGSQLDDKSLSTFMVEAESIVNCQPLAVTDELPRMPRSVDTQSAADHEIFCCPTSSWILSARGPLL